MHLVDTNIPRNIVYFYKKTLTKCGRSQVVIYSSGLVMAVVQRGSLVAMTWWFSGGDGSDLVAAIVTLMIWHWQQ